MLNKVATINGLDVSAVSKRFMHCTITRWREGADAKSHLDCVMTEEELNALVGE